MLQEPVHGHCHGEMSRRCHTAPMQPGLHQVPCWQPQCLPTATAHQLRRGTSARQRGDVCYSQSPGEPEHPGQALLSPGNPTNPNPCPGKCTQTSPCAALPACTLCSITGRRAGCIGNCVKHPVMCWNTRRVFLEEK